MSRVYSYLRFSDPKQAAGHSAERQAAYAKRWAEDRGLALDESLSLRDEGLSAFHQRHVRQGALGAFLRAIEEGAVPAGSFLIVEGLDRLSRAEPIQAQAQLAQIVNAGITVVTASDGKEYNRARLKEQPMDLVYSLLVMIRAHEESDTKSKRVMAAIRRQCDGWIAGTWRGMIRNGSDPSWVQWNAEANRFELIEERAAAIREAIRLFLSGEGGENIRRKVDVQMSKASLYKLLKRPDLIGVREFDIGGERFRLTDYYPRLISDEHFAELQAQSTNRFRRKGKGEIPGVLTGIRRLFCGYCGYAMQAQNMSYRHARKPDGGLYDGQRRILCGGHSKGDAGCESKRGGVSVAPAERALFAFCSDQINLARLTAGDDRVEALRDQVARLEADIAEHAKQIDRVTDAMLSSDAPPAAFAKRARELESSIEHLKIQLAAAQVELQKASHTNQPAAAEAWASIARGALDLDYDARMKARQLVADTFERIVIYDDGVTPEERGKGLMTMVLLAKGGRARSITFPKILNPE